MKKNKHTVPASGSSKSGILANLLSPDALARIRKKSPTLSTADNAAQKKMVVGPMQKGDQKLVPPSTLGIAPKTTLHAPPKIVARSKNRADKCISTMADKTSLEKEHPAVIAKYLQKLSQAERVSILKNLPGPIARSVVRRLT